MRGKMCTYAETAPEPAAAPVETHCRLVLSQPATVYLCKRTKLQVAVIAARYVSVRHLMSGLARTVIVPTAGALPELSGRLDRS